MTVSEVIIDLSEPYIGTRPIIDVIEEPTGSIYTGYEPIIENLTITPCPTVVVQAPGAPEPPDVCTGTPKYSGDSILLETTPNGGVGPYYVRFWRKSSPGPYTELGTVNTTVEGNTASYNIGLVDADVAGAVGDPNAGIPLNDTTGNITDPEDGTDVLSSGKIRVATTIYDSCPTTPKTCLSYCDVSLACVAPVCNFIVT